MKISLDKADIDKAMTDYVIKYIAPPEGSNISITMRAGRGDKGFSAEVDVQTPGTKPSNEENVVTKTTKNTAKADAKAAEKKLDAQKPDRVQVEGATSDEEAHRQVGESVQENSDAPKVADFIGTEADKVTHAPTTPAQEDADKSDTPNSAVAGESEEDQTAAGKAPGQIAEQGKKDKGTNIFKD